MTTCMPERFEVAQDNVAIINAVEITLEALTGKATKIKRINEKIVYENKGLEVDFDNQNNQKS